MSSDNLDPDESSSRIGVRVEANPKWIRATSRGQTVIDTRRARNVWENRYYPAWYLPVEDIAGELRPNGITVDSTTRGVATRCDLVLEDRGGIAREVLADAAWRHLDSPVEELRGLARMEWESMDSWFEEDVEVFVHPRSPEVRVDTLASSKHVRVIVDGEQVADSVRSTILYETGLPPRYYLPKADVRMELLTPTETVSACPYKGWADYWSVTVAGGTHEDVAWGYRTPLPESEGVAGHICFYDEKLDIEIDGVRQSRPSTKFS